MSEENLLKVAISDTVIETMLPDKKDYFKMPGLVNIAKALDGPNVFLVMSHISNKYDPASVYRSLEEGYGCDVPSSIHVLRRYCWFGKRRVPALKFPHHAYTYAVEKFGQPDYLFLFHYSS